MNHFLKDPQCVDLNSYSYSNQHHTCRCPHAFSRGHQQTIWDIQHVTTEITSGLVQFWKKSFDTVKGKITLKVPLPDLQGFEYTPNFLAYPYPTDAKTTIESNRTYIMVYHAHVTRMYGHNIAFLFICMHFMTSTLWR